MGVSSQFGETFQFINDPIKHVMQTNGLLDQVAEATDRTEQDVQDLNNNLGLRRSDEINSACLMGKQQWNDPEAELGDEKRVQAMNATPVPGEDASITAKEAGINEVSIDTVN